MATDLGKVGMRTRGTWNNTTTYEVMDVVSYNNGTYIARQAVPAGTLPTNTTYWQVGIAPEFTSGRFVTEAISVGDNTIDINNYTPFSGTLPTSGDKTIACINGFWSVNDPGATLAMAGNKIFVHATKANPHIGINWITIP